jgi:hypothetical protein
MSRETVPARVSGSSRGSAPKAAWKRIQCNPSRFDITAMTVGKPRSWNVLNDIGAGTASTPVYPVKVSYTQLWWSRESVRTQKGIAVYGCYYSTLSEWVCALNSSVHKEPMLVQPR